ncbi:MAG: hypothetical protein J0H26_01265, partial [Alphaproteobacteria bacterium]|nr:hypothetical protein [Alphaproteobacteria bacterium]
MAAIGRPDVTRHHATRDAPWHAEFPANVSPLLTALIITRRNYLILFDILNWPTVCFVPRCIERMVGMNTRLKSSVAATVIASAALIAS